MINKTISTNTTRPTRHKRLLNVPWITMLLLSIFMWQCKKNDFTKEVKGVCPAVLSTDPGNGDSNVVINKKITVVFNEVMDSSTINAKTFVLKQGANQVAGVVTCSGNSAVFSPVSYLAPNTVFTVAITTAAEDRSGIYLPQTYNWSFTTGTGIGVDGPMVISTDPANSMKGVPINRKITAVFNKAMKPSTINTSTYTLMQGINTVPGTITYTGVTATFTPTANLAANTLYTGTVSASVADLAGDPLSKNYTWSFTTGSSLDNMPPTVLSTDPGNKATNVALNKLISATFSKSMDPSTINANNFTLKQGILNIPGVITYSGLNAVFSPSAKLAPSTIYTASITNGAKDLAGNAMASNYTWSFTTGAAEDLTPPVIISTDPANASINSALNKIISANFSKSMNPLTINSSTFLLKRGSNIVMGTVSYSGTTASFTPSANLLPAVTYTATVTNSVKDLAGNTMVNNYTWSFNSLDNTHPTVMSTDPANAATNVSLNQLVTVTFDKAMNNSTINASTYVLQQGGNTVSGSISYSRNAATYTPAAKLMPATTYTVTIKTGAQDLAGNGLMHNYIWTFTTGNAADTTRPKVTTINPANTATGVALNKALSAGFSKTMNSATITSSTFLLKLGTTSVPGTVSYSLTTATFTPLDNLLSGSTYTATITTGAKDLAGNAIATDYVWTFSTVSPLGPQTVNLNSAGNFAILSGAGVTNSGLTIINGDLGTSPTGTVTGFPPGKVNGNIHAADPTAATAKGDLTTAYNDAAGRSTNAISLAGDMKGLTFYPGLYVNSSSVELSSGNVTLDAKGDANAVFIFQMGSTLTTFTGTKVILAGGAQAKNIFWSVGSSATLGSYSTFYGNILSDQSISLNTGVTLNGRALTRIASVTLLTDTVTKP